MKRQTDFRSEFYPVRNTCFEEDLGFSVSEISSFFSSLRNNIAALEDSDSFVLRSEIK